jgi:hypothetical protein
MFGATDSEIKLAGNVEDKVIYVTGVLIYTIDSILYFKSNLALKNLYF